MISKKQLIDNLIIYVIFNKFHWKNQQVIIISIGHFSNNIFPVVQYFIENNQ